MTSKEYLLYLILAVLMLLIFDIFPLIFLAFYPFRCCQTFLNHCLSLKYKYASQTFMDAFHGCYKDSTRDYRHFATLYLLVRYSNYLMYLLVDYNLCLLTSLFFLVLTPALVAKFQPYKSKKSNTIDIVLLLTLIFITIMVIMHRTDSLMFPNKLLIFVMTIAFIISPGYVLYLILGQKLLNGWQYCKTFLLKKVRKFRSEMEFEDQALLNHGGDAIN